MRNNKQRPSVTPKKDHLIIFNLELDLDSTVLAAAHEWATEFAQLYPRVYVFSNRVGKYSLPSNVTVSEMSWSRNKINFIKQFFRLSFMIIKLNRKLDIFYHMTSYSLMVFGPWARICHTRQGIWYSHSIADFAIKYSHRFADFLVSSTRFSLPIDAGKKFTPIGHGISIQSDSYMNVPNPKRRSGTIVIGRITRIKRIEELIDALGENLKLAEFYYPIHLFGPIEDPDYFEFLKREAVNKGVEMSFMGAVSYSEIRNNNVKYQFIFSGTPKSTDKALLEACASGCIPLTSNIESQRLTGADLMWQNLELKHPEKVALQLEILSSCSSTELNKFQNLIASTTKEQNNLKGTVGKIAELFRS